MIPELAPPLLERTLDRGERHIAPESLAHPPALTRAFALMDQYRDQPMDLADASPVAAAEVLKGHRHVTMQIVS